MQVGQRVHQPPDRRGAAIYRHDDGQAGARRGSRAGVSRLQSWSTRRSWLLRDRQHGPAGRQRDRQAAFKFRQRHETRIQPWRKRGDIGHRVATSKDFSLHHHQRQQQPVPIAGANPAESGLPQQRGRLSAVSRRTFCTRRSCAENSQLIGWHVHQQAAARPQHAAQLRQRGRGSTAAWHSTSADTAASKLASAKGRR